MRIRLTPRAANEILETHAFLRERSPQAAAAVTHAIRGTITSLAEQPFSGLQTDDAAVRVRLVGTYRYKVFYSVTSAIEILHVRHPSRGPEWR